MNLKNLFLFIKKKGIAVKSKVDIQNLHKQDLNDLLDKVVQERNNLNQELENKKKELNQLTKEWKRLSISFNPDNTQKEEKQYSQQLKSGNEKFDRQMVKKAQELERREKEVVQAELLLTKHRQQFNELLEELIKEHNNLKKGAEIEKDAFDLIKKEWMLLFAQLPEQITQIKEERSKLKSVIQKDLELLKAQETWNISERRNAINAKGISSRRNIKHFKRSSAVSREKNGSIKTGISEPEKEIKTELVLTKLIKPQFVKQEKPLSSLDLPELLDEIRRYIVRGDIRMARKGISETEIRVERIKKFEEKQVLKYEIEDLKASIKLALLG